MFFKRRHGLFSKLLIFYLKFVIMQWSPKVPGLNQVTAINIEFNCYIS